MKVLVTVERAYRLPPRDALLRGHYVITLSTRPDGPNGVEHHQLDVASDEATELASKVEAIVHLAGLSNASVSFADPFQFNRVNALGTLAILEGARRSGARVVFASSQRIYRPPCSQSRSWLIERRTLQLQQAVWGILARDVRPLLRPTNSRVEVFSVYGPGLKVVGGTSVAAYSVGRAPQGKADNRPREPEARPHLRIRACRVYCWRWITRYRLEAVTMSRPALGPPWKVWLSWFAS